MPISFSSLSSTLTSFFKSAPAQSASEKSSAGFHLWGTDGFSFADILDIVNPLQHLPIISTVYRALTGDSVAPAPRVLGDTLFGGPVGAAVGAANALLEYASGKDAGEHMLAFLHLPSQIEEDPVLLANRTNPVLSSSAPRAVQSQADQQTILNAPHGRQRMAALDAYARNSRLLNALERQGTQGVHF